MAIYPGDLAIAYVDEYPVWVYDNPRLTSVPWWKTAVTDMLVSSQIVSVIAINDESALISFDGKIGYVASGSLREIESP